jgi:hypothetical protein
MRAMPVAVPRDERRHPLTYLGSRRPSPGAVGTRAAGPLGASEGAAKTAGRVASDHGGVAADVVRVPDGSLAGPVDPRAPRFDDGRR